MREHLRNEGGYRLLYTEHPACFLKVGETQNEIFQGLREPSELGSSESWCLEVLVWIWNIFQRLRC